jgi:hypothetical protein
MARLISTATDECHFMPPARPPGLAEETQTAENHQKTCHAAGSVNERQTAGETSSPTYTMIRPVEVVHAL